MKILAFVGILIIAFQSCKKTENNDSAYFDFSIYLTKDSLVTTQMDINNIIPDRKLISYNDIVSYDSAKHILELNYLIDTLFNYNGNIDGRGFVAVLNNDIKVYCGVFWSPIHSSINPNIVITLPIDNIDNHRRLEIMENYHYSTNNLGYSKINDERIIELFKNDNKLK